jgi:hypothetical protein
VSAARGFEQHSSMQSSRPDIRLPASPEAELVRIKGRYAMLETFKVMSPEAATRLGTVRQQQQERLLQAGLYMYLVENAAMEGDQNKAQGR